MNLLLLAVAIALLIGGIIGSFAPIIPGALVSLVGVYLHWWGTGFQTPSTTLLAALTIIGVFTLAVDWFSGAIGASVGGASRLTIAIAGIAGVVLLLALGPLGLLIGLPLVVFAIEFARTRDSEDSIRASLFTTLAILASSVAQALLTLLMLVVFLVAVFA